MKQPSLWTRYRIVFLSTALTVAFVLGAVAYRTASKTLLPPLTKDLGGIAMAQAARLEAADNLDHALAQYQRALSGQLGTADRVHVTKRCGVILWKQERYGEALRYLRWAQSQPQASLNGYHPLAGCLVQVGQLDAADQALDTWTAALAPDDPAHADALRLRGQIAVKREDHATARKLFEAAIALSPHHRAHVDLAFLNTDTGDRAGAIAHLTTYLSAAPPEKDTWTFWRILEDWTS